MAQAAETAPQTSPTPYCRLCLSRYDKINFKHLFALFSPNETVADIIHRFADVQFTENDQYSNVVCQECWEMLLAIRKYKSIIEDSDTKLKTNLWPKDALQSNNANDAIEVKKGENQNTGPNTETNTNNNNNTAPNAGEPMNIVEDFDTFNSDSDHEIVNMDELNVNTKDVKQEMDDEKEPMEDEPVMDLKRTENFEVLDLLPNSCRKNYPYKCPYCELGFRKRSTFLNHERNHKRKRCEICNESFKNSIRLFFHKRSHITDKKYVCPTCDNEYSLECSYQKHLETHLKIEELPKLSCEKCNESFKFKQDLKAHIKRNHDPDLTLCDFCGRMVKNLDGHSKTHLRPFKCNVCNSNFSTSTLLNTHLNRHITN